MGPTRRWAAAALAGALLAGVVTAAGPGPVGASTGRRKLHVVALDPAPGNDGVVDFGDVPPAGAFDPANGVFDVSAGDTFVEDLVVKNAKGASVGRAYTIVTAIRKLSGDALGYLQCTVRLPAGTVVFDGPFTFADFADNGITFAVVGGTGHYRGADGEVVVAPAPGGASLDFTFARR